MHSAGGALGLLFASFSLDLLVQFVARFTTRSVEVQLSLPVLLFTLGISVATGLLFGSDVSICRQCEDAPSQTVGRWTSR